MKKNLEIEAENDEDFEPDEPPKEFQQRKRKLIISPTKSSKPSRDEFETSLGANWRSEMKDIEGGLKMPKSLWTKLRSHQKAGVKEFGFYLIQIKAAFSRFLKINSNNRLYRNVNKYFCKAFC